MSKLKPDYSPNISTNLGELSENGIFLLQKISLANSVAILARCRMSVVSGPREIVFILIGLSYNGDKERPGNRMEMHSMGLVTHVLCWLLIVPNSTMTQFHHSYNSCCPRKKFEWLLISKNPAVTLSKLQLFFDTKTSGWIVAVLQF